MAVLGISVGIALVSGVITGFVINIDFIFCCLKDTEMFDDGYFILNYSPQDLDSTQELNFSQENSRPESLPETVIKGWLIVILCHL